MINNTWRIIIITLLFFFCRGVNAQPNVADSLKKLLSAKTTDTARVNSLNEFNKSLFNLNPDYAITVALSSRKLAENINYKLGLALALKNAGIGYYLKRKV